MEDAFGRVQKVLVLGGGSDIALSTVRRLVAQGCRTVLLGARRPDDLAVTVDELTKAGATTVKAVPFDATETDLHQGFADDMFAVHPDIDVVILAFAQLGDQEQLEREPAAAAELVRTNLGGAVSAGLAVAGHLRGQGHGTLVVLSSVAGQRARRSNYVYAATKAGLDAFAQGLGDALRGSGARVLIVRPGFVRTKMTEGLDPAPMSASAEEVAEAIVAGLASHKELVWAPAKLRFVFAVLRELPRPIWRKVSANM
jgi:decaprenylphospho-beta-D-erythro-pentofuranosid-2-ulose 2-reductase